MKQKVKLYYIKYALFFMMLYFFIFNPPFSFLPLSPKFILYLLVIPYFFKSKFYKYFGYFKSIFLAIIPIVVFSFFREIGLHKFEFFTLNVTAFFEFLMIPIVIVMMHESFTYKKDLIIDIIKVGCIAAFITILMILLPNINDFIRYQLLRTDTFTEAVSKRTFGLAESLTFSYGIIQGLMAFLILFYSKNNKKILFFIPFFILCVLFNARVGFSALIVGVVFYYIYKFKIVNIVLTAIAFFTVFFLITETSLFKAQKETIEWGLDFFTQSSDFLSGKKSDSNTLDTLFGDMFVLPTTESGWLVGYGVNIFGRHFGVSSDVGYIIQIYYGGVIYLFLLFVFVFVLFNYIRKLPRKEFLIGCSFIFILLLCNMKGNIFIPIGIMRLILLIIIYWVINFKNKTLKIEK